MYSAVKTVEVPRLAVSDILIQYHRLVLSQNSHGINSGVYTVREREVDNSVLSAERNCRFCKLLCQRVESGTLAARKKHCDHFLCHKKYPPVFLDTTSPCKMHNHTFRRIV